MKSKAYHLLIGFLLVIFSAYLCLFFIKLNQSPENPEYTITQYPSTTSSQAMFYTITDNDGHIALVDGGWRADAEQVREVIKEYHNKVDVWILTHPHPDHIGAFNEIYAAGDVEIGTIYAVPVDYDIYKAKAQTWDEFEIYEEFLALTENADNLVYLREDDTLKLFEMDMEVLHSFDNEQMAEVKDPCNGGSMIFKLTYNEKSMLFLADVGKGQSKYIYNKYADQLKADYVQMGHHGNGGLAYKIYDTIDPDVAFFDMPLGMVESDSLKAKEKWDYMQELGAEVYCYETAPNSVTLK